MQLVKGAILVLILLPLVAFIVVSLWTMITGRVNVLNALTSIRKVWIELLDGFALLFLVAGVAAEMVIRLLGARSYQGFGFGAGAVASFVSALVFHFCFYHLIKCPTCGKKLNKYKNGKNMPTKNAFTALEKGTGCRWCGWTPPTHGRTELRQLGSRAS